MSTSSIALLSLPPSRLVTPHPRPVAVRLLHTILPFLGPNPAFQLRQPLDGFSAARWSVDVAPRRRFLLLLTWYEKFSLTGSPTTPPKRTKPKAPQRTQSSTVDREHLTALRLADCWSSFSFPLTSAPSLLALPALPLAHSPSSRPCRLDCFTLACRGSAFFALLLSLLRYAGLCLLPTRRLSPSCPQALTKHAHP